MVLNLPIREVLPDGELDRAIENYENKTLDQFRLEGN